MHRRGSRHHPVLGHHAVEVGGTEGAGGARSGGHQGHAEPARGAGEAVGGVDRGLLVPDAHEPDLRPGERLPDRRVVDSWQAEGELDAQLLESSTRGGRPPSLSVRPPPRRLDDVELGTQGGGVEALGAQWRDVDERRALQDHVTQDLADGGSL